MPDRVRRHWPEYLMEAAGLGLFMIVAAACASAIEHPASPLRQLLPDPLVRRALMGAGDGRDVDRAGLLADGRAIRRAPQPGDDAHVLSPGARARRRRGRLHRRAVHRRRDGHCRRVAGPLALDRRADRALRRHAAGRRGDRCRRSAPRSAITFVLMTVVLHVSNHPRWSRYTGLCAGALVCLYITVEAPVSGMSLNPARSLGPALLTREFDTLWIYGVGPLTGHVAGGRSLRARARAAGRALRQAPSPHVRPLHLPLSLRSTTAMTSSQHYDVIIIGSGAGGGTLAYRLAPSGKRILILERGGYVPREKDNWSPRAVNVEAKYHTKEVWRTPDRHPLHPHTNYYVGGNTKFYGAALFRLRREDFGELRHARRRLAGVAHRLRRSRAVLRRGRSASTRCTASAASIRRSRRPAVRIRSRRSVTSRASRSCTTISCAPGIGRSTRRSG